MPRVRAGERRALRHLGRALRARAPQTAEASGLIPQHLRVTAVVVAHNGAEYLPGTLEALQRQTRRADFCVGVDTGSTDTSASILQFDLPTGSPVVGAPARAGFGTAVRTAVAEIPDRGAPGDAADWLWLLHDDSAPEPDALAELLHAVERAPSVTVAGAKQVAWDDRRALVDVGLSVSRWAERLTLIDVDEHDQGQYDARSDVFAVNSAGMLVRRDVWDSLRGFDPALHGVGDDVDLCWRNRLAGNRVVVVPAAVMRHAPARPHPVSAPHAARAAEVYLRLKHAAPWNVPLLAVGAVLGGLARLVLGLLAKDPAHGTGQLLGSLGGVCRPLQLWRSRRSTARTRQRPRSIVRPLVTSRRDVWSHRRSVLDAFTSRGAHPGAEPLQPTEEYIPSGDSNDDFAALATPARLWTGAGAVLAVVVLLAAALTGLHRLVGAGAVAGGALLPAAETPAAIWANATTWWTGLGTGYAAHGSPFSYVLWLLSLAGFGSANTMIVVTVVCALPLAGLSAWIAAGALTRSRGLRLWAAFFWGAAPALQVALGSGRLGALIAHLLLPLALLGVVRAVGAGLPSRILPDGVVLPGVGGTRSWTAGACAGLVLAIVTASAPSLLTVVVVGLAVTLVLGGRRARTLWWALVPVVALHLPYALSAVRSPRGILGDPGVPTPFDPAASWQHLLGFPVSFDPMLPPAAAGFLGAGPWSLVAAVLIGGPVVVLAAVALFSGRGRIARRLWLLAVLALVLAAVAPLLPVALGSASLLPVFPGPFVSVVALCLLAAALSGLPGLDAPPAGRRPAARRSLRLAGGVVLAVGPVLGLGLWLAPAVSGPPAVVAEPVVIPGTPAEEAPEAGPDTTGFGTAVELAPAAERPLPATAADRGDGPDRTRTLVITVDDDDTVTASLMRGSGTTLDALNPVYAARTLQGGGAPADDSASARTLRTTVAVIVGATGADPRGDLRDLGVGFVVLQQSGTAGDFLGGRIDAVPGLTAVGDTDAGRLWRVVPATLDDGTEDAGDRTARVRVVDADGRTQATISSSAVLAGGTVPPGEGGRKLVLAEESDPGWQASLDGERLDATSDGWQQAFALSADGGEVTVSYVSPFHPWAEAVQAVLLTLTLLLAIPLPSQGRVVRPTGRPHGSRPGPSPRAATGAGDAGTLDAEPQPVTSGRGSM
ncbi:glycosyltransferase family 2 protein [Arthrobacter sp. B0490]|uniref:glycosyltransferase family 2 protein n=1 Tax=Arthrobacter sp. B0490 TaxID=2058891 RepID=UPI0015E40EE4|nr:glycosyltransferase family 2 protein [Arthrobacter sp. B0490]